MTSNRIPERGSAVKVGVFSGGANGRGHGRWLAAILVGGLLLLGACSSTEADPTGQTWQLTELSGAAPVDGSTVDVTFGDDGTVSGSGGCNQFNGSATVSDGTIDVSDNLASTQMACEEAISTQEQVFFAALTSAATYEINGDELVLSAEDGTVLARFE